MNYSSLLYSCRQIAVPYGKVHSNGVGNNNHNGTAIPLPASARRCPPDKVRPLPPTPTSTQTGPGECHSPLLPILTPTGFVVTLFLTTFLDRLLYLLVCN